jgi:transposase
MSKALSFDLRVRVLAAVAGGSTHRQAAERFGVSAASVSRWRTREREQGDAQPKAMGGDRKSGRIEAHTATILSVLEETPDITIEELRQALGEKGLSFGFGTIRRFFARHEITRKKDGTCRGTGSSRRESRPRGLVREPARPRSGAPRLHRRDLGLDETWASTNMARTHGPYTWPLSARGAPAGRRAAWPLEDHDLRGRSDHARHDRPLGARWTDQP